LAELIPEYAPATAADDELAAAIACPYPDGF
jgi:hypothetical protein